MELNVSVQKAMANLYEVFRPQSSRPHFNDFEIIKVRQFTMTIAARFTTSLSRNERLGHGHPLKDH